jgi:hypothetical protein
MKRQRHVLVRSVSLIMATLLLFLAGWGNTLIPAKATAKAPVQKVATAQKAGKTADKTDAPAEAQLSTTAFEAVVTPATSFDFGQSIWLLPPPVMAVLLLLATVTVRLILTEPYFYFSYFRHVFGHFIAPNAP